jgi:hypothetical protein
MGPADEAENAFVVGVAVGGGKAAGEYARDYDLWTAGSGVDYGLGLTICQ